MVEPVLILGAANVTVEPGKQASVTVRVKNLGRRVTAYELEVLGDAAGWARPERAEVNVRPRGGEAETRIVFSPPGGAAAPSGELPFAVRATSKVDGSRGTVEGLVTVGAQAGIVLSVAETQRRGRWRASFPVQVTNSGNESVRIAVTAFDPTGEVELAVDEPVHTIGVGRSATAKVQARVRRPMLRGSPAQRQLKVETHDHPFGAPMPAPGQPAIGVDPLHREQALTFTQKPVLTRSMMALVAFVPLLLVALFASRFFLGDDSEPGLDPPVPVAARDIDVVAGAAELVVSWEPVSGAIGYTVQAGSGTPLEVADGVLTATIEGLDPETAYEVTIVSIGPEGTGNSAPSEPRMAATTSPPSLDGAPADLAFDPATARLSWSYDSTIPIEELGFVVLIDGQIRPAVGAGVTFIELVGLSPGQHEARVKAVAGEQESALSAPLSFSFTDAATDGNGGTAVGGGNGGEDGNGGGEGNGNGGGDGGATAAEGIIVLLDFDLSGDLADQQTARDTAEALAVRLGTNKVTFGNAARLVLALEDGTTFGEGEAGFFVFAFDFADFDAARTFCTEARSDGLLEQDDTCIPVESKPR